LLPNLAFAYEQRVLWNSKRSGGKYLLEVWSRLDSGDCCFESIDNLLSHTYTVSCVSLEKILFSRSYSRDEEHCTNDLEKRISHQGRDEPISPDLCSSDLMAGWIGCNGALRNNRLISMYLWIWSTDLRDDFIHYFLLHIIIRKQIQEDSVFVISSYMRMRPFQTRQLVDFNEHPSSNINFILFLRYRILSSEFLRDKAIDWKTAKDKSCSSHFSTLE
jgi:hypothetical protein